MSHWIAQFEVETEAMLVQEGTALRFRHPHTRFEVELRDLASRPLAERPLLDMRLFFEAPDIQGAEKQAKENAREFLYLLSLVTQLPFRILQIKKLVDWTRGLTEREAKIYVADRSRMPESLLNQDLMDTISVLTSHEIAPEVSRTMRWFASGLRSKLLDDKFQCFWFVLEALSEYHKRAERVPDRCPRCREPLFCQMCNETPMHRPYPKQAIEEYIKRIVVGWDDAFTTLNRIRNGLMHGAHIEELEASMQIPFHEAVDAAGRIAWKAILGSMTLPTGGVSLLQVSTFCDQSLQIGAHVLVGNVGDPNDPDFDEQSFPSVTFEIEDRPSSGPATQ